MIEEVLNQNSTTELVSVKCMTVLSPLIKGSFVELLYRELKYTTIQTRKFIYLPQLFACEFLKLFSLFSQQPWMKG